MRATKIVATLGPASASPEIIGELAQSGVDVFRLNASHGTAEERAERVRTIRQVSLDLGRELAILLDLQGPKLRLGMFSGGGCVLKKGDTFTITTETLEGNRERASTSFTDFARDVRTGDTVLLNDGVVRLRVLDTDGVAARCLVVNGGPVGDRKGINLPGAALSTPSLTPKDLQDLDTGLEQGVDMIALSLVRKPQDVMRLRLYLEEKGARLPVIAKIEKPEGWHNLLAILDECDGVMVPRGDLGV